MLFSVRAMWAPSVDEFSANAAPVASGLQALTQQRAQAARVPAATTLAPRQWTLRAPRKLLQVSRARTSGRGRRANPRLHDFAANMR